MLVLFGHHTHKRTYVILSQYRDALQALCSTIILTNQVSQKCKSIKLTRQTESYKIAHNLTDIPLTHHLQGHPINFQQANYQS